MANEAKPIYTKPIFWVGFVGLAVIGYLATESDAPAKAATQAKQAAKRASTQTGDEAAFAALDAKASFPPVKEETKNAFTPVVARKKGIGHGDLGETIPAELAGGEGTWVYTGSATTDGAQQALVENRATGDAVFLRAGERWKSAYVVEILDASLILRGPGGTKTIGISDDSSTQLAKAGGPAPTTLPPVTVNVPPGLAGTIDPSGSPAAAAPSSDSGSTGFGGRGNRGRRNRGGGNGADTSSVILDPKAVQGTPGGDPNK